MIRNFLFSFVFYTFLIVKTSWSSFDEITFHNVGQGHCVVAYSKKEGLVVIDAGSSSTVGIDEMVEKKSEKNLIFSRKRFLEISEKK